ncbi:hypothetical protein [Streptococcus dysgalactiae]|uniref:Uncharacterized protein n=1 Tax=Streptococcus dysgalactiae subsp. equisimilis TaxID=119602 RepID=A0A9X8T2B5_STREQ|nr:hypothetical protein [Streptococcus dysgalactiae]BAH81899.1 hypothetical protein SDEG_1404 [Streptococcus dysgalactiae subsp. equisimilis GGS_124]SUN62355.1 Uncharacterised protein [Streptococcus dysgalactiae subsp. equisimilis]VTS34843.1 Uncharacterised protein [Streptococcus dysgalactiae subsp. equisimilis]VTT06474.1 Uncharacterised protein [Streptococcus dysgalactiae subsp. equisimilis]
MKVLFGLIVIVGFMYFFFRLVIGVRRKLITPAYGKTKKYTTYFVNFKNTDRPDLRTSSHFNEVAKVKVDTEDSYSVASSINDKKLRDLIMSELGLKPSYL